MIRQSVIDRWHEFSEPLEGRVNSMYLDVKGLVTTCVGNLIDTPQEAAKLPWRHGIDGRAYLDDPAKFEEQYPLATREEVFAAWNDLKARQALSKRHWRYASLLNDLRLTEEAMNELVASKFAEFYAYLKKHHFPDIDSYPADAVLGIMSMAWACGPGFPRTFTNFKRCVLAGDWNGAVATCKIRETNNPGVVPRNKANRTCFGNAAIVVQSGLDPARVYWPGVPSLESVPAPALPVPAVTATNSMGGWIGDPQLGLPDDSYDELSNARRKDIADK